MALETAEVLDICQTKEADDEKGKEIFYWEGRKRPNIRIGAFLLSQCGNLKR